jgi:dolichol-phosphate mannosyltransferase
VNTALLWALASFGLNHIVAAVIAGEISTMGNFVLNDRFTFAGHGASFPYWRRAMHYNAVALAGTVLSVGMLAALILGCGMYYLLANLAAMAAATLSNYALNSRFTWSLHLDAPLQAAKAGA